MKRNSNYWNAGYEVGFEEGSNKNTKLMVYLVIISLIFLALLIMGANKFIPDAIEKGKELGRNETLSNNTLMLEVANNVNLFYLQQYDVIPIYVVTPLGTKVYMCSNFSEVKR